MAYRTARLSDAPQNRDWRGCLTGSRNNRKLHAGAFARWKHAGLLRRKKWTFSNICTADWTTPGFPSCRNIWRNDSVLLTRRTVKNRRMQITGRNCHVNLRRREPSLQCAPGHKTTLLLFSLLKALIEWRPKTTECVRKLRHQFSGYKKQCGQSEKNRHLKCLLSRGPKR